MKAVQNLLRNFGGEIDSQKEFKRTSRRYSDKLKKAALKVAAKAGKKEVAAALDVSTATISRWTAKVKRTDAGGKTRRKKKAVNIMEAVIVKAKNKKVKAARTPAARPKPAAAVRIKAKSVPETVASSAAMTAADVSSRRRTLLSKISAYQSRISETLNELHLMEDQQQ
jgi:transposase-like protein